MWHLLPDDVLNLLIAGGAVAEQQVHAGLVARYSRVLQSSGLSLHVLGVDLHSLALEQQPYALNQLVPCLLHNKYILGKKIYSYDLPDLHQ